MNFKHTLPSLVILLLVVLPGCTQTQLPEWLVGKWIFDTEATIESSNSAMANQAEPADSLAQLQALVLPMYGTMELSISQKEITATFKGGEKVVDISIHKIESDKVTLKRSNGNLIEYHRTDKGFWTTSDDGKLELYFKKKDTSE